MGQRLNNCFKIEYSTDLHLATKQKPTQSRASVLSIPNRLLTSTHSQAGLKLLSKLLSNIPYISAPASHDVIIKGSF